jgi:hypothetical protein
VAVLQFDQPTHTYTLDGVRVPSVTQVLKPLYNFEGIPLATLNAKARLGTAVHRACELLDNDDLDEESEEGRAALAPLAGYLAGYKKFKSDMRPKLLANEQLLHHPVHRYAGQIDRSYAFEGHVWDVDLKSTVSMSPIVGLQTAAYTEMLRAQTANTSCTNSRIPLISLCSCPFSPFNDSRSVFHYDHRYPNPRAIQRAHRS